VRDQTDPVFGDMSRLLEMRSGGVKGNLMTSRLWYVRDRFGESELLRIAKRLPPAARAIVERPPLPFVWCSFGDMMDIDRAILEGPMGGDLSKMHEFGGAIASHDLPTIYTVFFKIGTPRFLMKRVASIASTYVRDSPMRGSDMSDGRVRVVQTGVTFPYYFCAFGVCGWFHSAMHLSGGKNIEVVHPACRHQGAANCEWHVRFE
jgi:hypothetical protein